MNRNILFFICLSIFEQIITAGPDRSKKVFYLPMKKDHKYGDDICYYRQEIDEKHDYTIYYVKPCEKGKYCEFEVENQPFGFCRDIPTKAIDFPTYEGDCNSNGECLDDLVCDGKCKKVCPAIGLLPFRTTLDNFSCLPTTAKTTDDGKHCFMYEPQFNSADPKVYDSEGTLITVGKYPGLPKECGIIRYRTITDVDPAHSTTSGGNTIYETYTRWIEESREWCTVGEAEDGDFVTNWRFCKSGFTLLFYPKGDLVDPSNERAGYEQDPFQMCVTPIQIDKSNPEAGVIVTYKIKDQEEQKYNYYKYYDDDDELDEEAVIKSKLYSEFSEEFKNASDEDKKSCYKIPQALEGDSDEDYVGNCQNIKILKLFYFYTHINEYLFYKNRKDLEKVLHFKIQHEYHRYYEISTYLNLNYLFLLLILILL